VYVSVYDTDVDAKPWIPDRPFPDSSRPEASFVVVFRDENHPVM
jgi:hypothetical protein